MLTERPERRFTSPGSWTAKRESVMGMPVMPLPARLCAILSALLLTACCTGSPVFGAKDAYTAIASRMEALRSCGFASVTQVGESAKGRPIYAVVFTKAPRAKLSSVPRELVISGQHGNEPIPIHATVRLMSDLANGKSGLPEHALEKVVLVFVPVVNPDGFVANKRCNAHDADLNRDWDRPSQPETLAISRLAERLRPNVLVDEHQWTDEDPNRPNCVEIPAYGATQEAKLAKTLAEYAVSTSPLGIVDYRPQSNPSLAHRHFTAHGTAAMLVETGPGWGETERVQAYMDVIRSTVRGVTGGSPEAIATMAALNTSKAKNGSWLTSICVQPRVRRGNWNKINWAAVCLAAVGAGLAWASKPKKSTRSQVDWYVEPSKFRAFTVSDLVQSDLTPRDKLVIIHRCRLRPTDRPKTKTERRVGVSA